MRSLFEVCGNLFPTFLSLCCCRNTQLRNILLVLESSQRKKILLISPELTFKIHISKIQKPLVSKQLLICFER